MKVQVQFSGPVVVSSEDLAAFLAMAGTGAHVEVVSEEAAPVTSTTKAPRKPSKPKNNTPRKPRKPKVEEEDSPKSNIEYREQARQMFGALVESNFDAAKDLLGNFGVEVFGDLTDEQLPTFHKKMSEYNSNE